MNAGTMQPPPSINGLYEQARTIVDDTGLPYRSFAVGWRASDDQTTIEVVLTDSGREELFRVEAGSEGLALDELERRIRGLAYARVTSPH